MKSLRTIPAIGVLFFALVGQTNSWAEETAAIPLKPCIIITGADSHVKIPRYCRITSDEDWTRIWQEHMGQKPIGQSNPSHVPYIFPMIDFDKYMVIGIFQGKGINLTRLNVVSIIEERNRIVFRYNEESYQTLGSISGKSEDRVTAYGFFVLPRSKKPMVIEEDVHIYKGDPSLWQERITFPEQLPSASSPQTTSSTK